MFANHAGFPSKLDLCIVSHLIIDTLLKTIYRSTIKTLNSEAVSQVMSCLASNQVLLTLPQIEVQEASVPRPYGTSLSRLCSSFCCSLYSYHERIGLTSNPLCTSCVRGFLLSIGSHLTDRKRLMETYSFSYHTIYIREMIEISANSLSFHPYSINKRNILKPTCSRGLDPCSIRERRKGCRSQSLCVKVPCWQH